MAARSAGVSAVRGVGHPEGAAGAGHAEVGPQGREGFGDYLADGGRALLSASCRKSAETVPWTSITSRACANSAAKRAFSCHSRASSRTAAGCSFRLRAWLRPA